MTNSYTTGPNLFRKFLLAGVTLALSVLFSVSSWGQAATYNFSASAGTYTPITGGTVFFATGATYDDNISASITIPSFTYNGTAYTVLRVNTNGWASFGAATTTAGYTPLSGSITGGNAILAPFGEDQQNSATSEIRYEDTGTEFVVQWKDARRFGTAETLNYQLRLQYTASPQTFSFVYGNMANGADTNPQVGHKSVIAAGTIGTTVFNLTLKNMPVGTSCDWIDAVRGRLNSETMLLNSTTNNQVTCASGTTFTFTPQSGLAATWVNPVTTFTANTTWGITAFAATPAWTAPTNANRYNVQYRRAADCAWTPFSGNPVSTASAALTGLADGTTYHLRVQPFNNTTNNTAGYSHITAGTIAANSDGYVAAGSFTTQALPPTVTGFTPNQPLCSSGGQTVVLTGTSFVAGAVPRFNGFNATGVVINSTTQITCVTPVGITAGNITVQTSAGTSATGAANAYSISAIPLVDLAPNDTVAPCGSFATPVTASNTATGLSTTYAWSNSGTLSAATGASVNVATTTNQNYVVTATDSYGCTGTRTLYAIPTTPPAITVTPSVPYFCGSGGTVGVSVSSSNDPNYTYTFSIAEGGSISNVTAAGCDFTVSSTSAFKTRAVDAGTGCAVDVFTSVGVYPFPTPAMSATPNTICEGQTSVLASGLSAGNFSAACITPPSGLSTPPAGITPTNLVLNGVLQTLPSGITSSGGLDDGKFGPVPVGFSFNFFGAAQTQLNVGTNGVLNFDTFAAFNGGQYIFTGGFPNAANPASTIAVCARDLRFGTPATYGTLRYWTEGYAPNRRFVIQYINVPIWSGVVTTPALSGFNNVEAVLYETIGQIEIRVANATNGTSITAAEINKYIGLQDATRTIGATAPNCSAPFQNNFWNGLNTAIPSALAWRFSPPSNYTTTWTPSADINGAIGVPAGTSGTNMFTRTTNALSTVGTNTFNLVVTDQTTLCSNSASPAQVNVEVLATPPTPITAEVTGYGSILGSGSAASTPLTICGTQSVTINCTTTLSGIESIRWYNAATGGTLLGTGASYTTPSLSTSDTVWVETYNGTCTSAARHLFRIDYNTPPAISVGFSGGNEINCGTGVTYNITYGATSANDPNYTYTWTSDGIADTFVPSGASLALSSDSTTVTTVTAFDASTGCSISAVKAFSVYDFPNIVPTSADSIICIGDSTVVSSGVAVGTFSVNCTSYNFKVPGANPVTLLTNNGVTSVPLQSGNLDDGGWSAIPLGFTFDFFGVDYTTLNAGTNGVVQFGTYNGNGGFVLPRGLGDFTYAGLPSVNEPLGVIALCATDLDMQFNGSVRYWTEGVSPNRIFILEYNNVDGYSSGSFSMQLHLYETTGVFDIHAKEATGTQAKSIGVNSPTGLVGAAAQRCNIAPVGSERWSGNTNEIITAFPWAWRFNPPVDYTFTWSPSGQISGATDEADIVAYPTTTGPATQNYSIQVTDNVSGCVGTPVSYPVQIIDLPGLPTITAYGTFSNVDGTNGATFCGSQAVEWYCSDALPIGWGVKYYTQAVGGTSPVFNATDTLTLTLGLVAQEIAANDTIWAALYNGSCEGPRRLVEFAYQAPDTIVISNSSPINCGPSNVLYNSTLIASSTAPYTYTWDASPALNTTLGDSVIASTSVTRSFSVNGTDGYCYNTESTAVSRYNFPTVVPTSQYDSICPGGTAVLDANVSAGGFTIQSKGYSPEIETGATVNFLCQDGVEITPLNSNGFPSLDDGGWIGVPIGFPFNFLGTDYSTVNISTNGNLQFGTAGTFSAGFTSVTIPSSSTPNNFIAPCWGDLDFGNGAGEGSSIRYYVTGVAPNRIFNVKWDGPRFLQSTSRYAAWVALNEATGIIELDIQQVTHNGVVNTVMGAENFDGTIGGSPVGRSNGTWQVTAPEGWLLIPPADYSFSWLPSAEIDGATNLDTAIASPSVSTQYQLIVTDNATTCDNSVTNQTYVNVDIASALPTQGFTASDNTPTTGGVLETVTLTPLAGELGGETYLWNISPAAFNFVNGTNALSRSPQVQFTETGSFTVSLSLTSCTGTVSSTEVNFINPIATYCFPSFTTACDFGDEIGDVEIFNPQGQAIMSHLGTGCTTNPTGYQNYGLPLTGAGAGAAPINGITSCTFYQGSTYTIEVSSGYFGDYFGAWLDVNNDGDFSDPLEFLGSSSTPGNFASFELGIPSSNVVYGAHKMRIICADTDNLGGAPAGPLTQNLACLSDQYGECHDYTVFIQPPVILNDIPAFATSVQYSTNLNYPTCYPLTGNTSLATNSPESAASVISGGDTWYRFTAQSTAVSIKVTSSSMDDIIALYSRDNAGAYILIASENVGVGNSDYEQLNVDGLTAGTQYWIAVGSNSGGGAFGICIQNLMRSGCNTVVPAGGLRLCDSYRAVYRGAPSQGVTYTFNFSPVSGTLGSVTSVSGTNGLITLSNPTLALRYGGVYDVDVDATYTLTNSAGTPEVINVAGVSTDPRCSGVSIQAHPNLEVRSNQRCPATLLRSNYLVGTTVAGSSSSFVCGAINYSYEFIQVTSCADASTLGLPDTLTTSAASPYLGLGVLGNLPNQGSWDVRIRPNFSYGPGVFGPVHRILVNNTAAGSELEEGSVDGSEKVSTFVAANLYPNPNNGEMVNLNVAGIESDNVFVRITDAMGRIVYTNRFTVEGSLNTIVTFAEPLASGIYNVEFSVDGQIMTERMIVAKQ